MSEAKDNLLEHSEAKVKLYKSYIEAYISVIQNAGIFDRIHIYEPYCGRGVFENQKLGSSLEVFNSIAENRRIFFGKGRQKSQINLYLNDLNEDHIRKVKEYIEPRNEGYCNVSYSSHDANEMLIAISKKVNSQGRNERSFVFIDPYGYKDIVGENLKDILKNKYTEILLFVPLSHLYRFRRKALEGEIQDGPYMPLRRLLHELFDKEHPVRRSEEMSIFEFANFIRMALTFENSYYSLDHSIERSKGTYYSIFFMTSNLKGVEKMLEAKWKQDPVRGAGYSLKISQKGLFDDLIQEEKIQESLTWLGKKLEDQIRSKGEMSNLELYEFVLRNNFLPKHLLTILIDWENEDSIVVKNIEGSAKRRRGAFYLSDKEPRIKIKLK